MAKKEPALDHLFQALADPTRRAVLDALRAGPVAITDLAAPHDMALPSFTKHIAMLEKAGLIRTMKKGRSRICTLRSAQLNLVDTWLEAHRTQDNDSTARDAALLAIARQLYPPRETA